MVKQIDDSALDAAAAVIDDCTAIILCSAAPDNYAGVAGLTLATASVDYGDFSPVAVDNDYRIAVASQSAVPVSSSGTGTHLVGTDGSSTILFVTETAPVIVSSGGLVNIPGFNITFTANLPGSGDMLASVYDPNGVAADAFARGNHTGTQAISTVTGLQSALDDKADDTDLTGMATVYVHDGNDYVLTAGRIFVGPEDPEDDGFTLTDGDQWIDPS